MSEKGERQFYILSESWYAKGAMKTQVCIDPDFVDEILVGIYHEDGGTSGEFAIRFFTLGQHVSPRLEAFHDSWKVLSEMPDLIAALGEMDDKLDSSREHEHVVPTMKQIIEKLKELGFKDSTKRDHPYV